MYGSGNTPPIKRIRQRNEFQKDLNDLSRPRLRTGSWRLVRVARLILPVVGQREGDSDKERYVCALPPPTRSGRQSSLKTPKSYLNQGGVFCRTVTKIFGSGSRPATTIYTDYLTLPQQNFCYVLLLKEAPLD